MGATSSLNGSDDASAHRGHRMKRAEFICLSFGFAILFLATVLTQVMP